MGASAEEGLGAAVEGSGEDDDGGGAVPAPKRERGREGVCPAREMEERGLPLWWERPSPRVALAREGGWRKEEWRPASG